MRAAAPWIVLGAATAALALALGAGGLPSPTLFAALLVGLAAALARPGAGLRLPRWSFVAAQAVCGVTLGAYLQSSALEALAGAWLPVMLASAATLALSLGTGLALARLTELDVPTATLGMVAGGASGIVSMADDLGADDRLVAFMQYLRVLVVVLFTPVLVAVFGGGGGGGGGGTGVRPPEDVLGAPRDWLITLAVAPAAALAARGLRMPAGPLLGPMLVASAVTLSGAGFAVPPVLRELAFALIGLQVGLRFTLDTVRRLGGLLAPVLGGLAALLIGCFGLAVMLHLTTPVSLRDAYLATTPGGIYAVLAVAFGAGADTTFILAVQGLRLLVVVLLAPLAVRRLVRTGGPSA
jgi:membrane AbrB-like protein